MAQEIEALTGARRQIEQELANLITFVAQGDLASPRLREEIQVREHRLVELDQQFERLRTAPGRGVKSRNTSRACGSRPRPRRVIGP